MKTYLLILIVFSMLFGSCKKEDPIKQTPVKEIFLDTNLVSYLIFKEGSYWVYKDSISLQMDTVTIISSGLSINEVKEYDSDTLIKRQTGEITYRHSYSFRRSSCFITSIPQYKSEFDASGIFMATPFGLVAIKSIDGVTHIIPAESSVSVGAFSFPRGIETDRIAFGSFWPAPVTPSPIQNPKYTYLKFVLAKDVGIIKRTMQNDSMHFVWELVDYKIVK